MSGNETSATIGKLAEALAKAKAEFAPILKDTENPAYARGGKAMKYADLSTIIEATEEALAKNGICIIQSPDVNVTDQSMSLTGVLVHSSGEWMRFVTTLPAVQRDRFDAQSCGSAITYARRYQYKSLIGAAEEDDDGNAAAGVGSKAAQQAIVDRKLNGKEVGITGHRSDAARFAAPAAQAEGGAVRSNQTSGAVPLKIVQFCNEEIMHEWKTRPHVWQRLGGDGLGTLVTGLTSTDAHFAREFMWYDEDPETGGFWYVLKSKADVLAEAAVSMGLEAKASPKAVSATPSSTRENPKNTESAPSTTNGTDESFMPVIEILRTVKGTMWLRYGSVECGCFDKKLWGYLTDGQGKHADLIMQEGAINPKTNRPYVNVVGVRKIGQTTFTDNTPDFQQAFR